jgi:hypothetical protein
MVRKQQRQEGRMWVPFEPAEAWIVESSARPGLTRRRVGKKESHTNTQV